jgi:hypothetical protein
MLTVADRKRGAAGRSNQLRPRVEFDNYKASYLRM